MNYYKSEYSWVWPIKQLPAVVAREQILCRKGKGRMKRLSVL